MSQTIPGVEKIVFAYGGSPSDVSIDGNKLSTDWGSLIEKLEKATAKGGIKGTGLKRIDTNIMCDDASAISSLKTNEGSFATLEIYELGETSTATYSIDNVNAIVNDRIIADPESEDDWAAELHIKAVVKS